MSFQEFREPSVEKKYPGSDQFPQFEIFTGRHQIPLRCDFYIEDAEELMRTTRNTFLFGPEQASALGLSKAMLDATDFTERLDWAETREDSRQGVYFGELTFYKADGDEKTVHVACKPFSSVTHRARALHEYVAYDLFSKDARIKSFTPLGIWMDEEGRATLLTYFEEDVISLDNFDWGKTEEDPLKDHIDLFTALKRAAFSLGLLHIKGYTHRDAQIKNMAVDRRNGGVRLIDLTSLRRIYEHKDPKTREETKDDWTRAVYADLNKLVESVVQKGYLLNDDAEDVRSIIEATLLDVHLGLVRHPSTLAFLFDEASRDVEMVRETIGDNIAPATRENPFGN